MCFEYRHRQDGKSKIMAKEFQTKPGLDSVRTFCPRRQSPSSWLAWPHVLQLRHDLPVLHEQHHSSLRLCSGASAVPREGVASARCASRLSCSAVGTASKWSLLHQLLPTNGVDGDVERGLVSLWVLKPHLVARLGPVQPYLVSLVVVLDPVLPTGRLFHPPLHVE